MRRPLARLDASCRSHLEHISHPSASEACAFLSRSCRCYIPSGVPARQSHRRPLPFLLMSNTVAKRHSPFVFMSSPTPVTRCCVECGTYNSPAWRLSPAGLSCNACGLRAKRKLTKSNQNNRPQARVASSSLQQIPLIDPSQSGIMPEYCVDATDHPALVIRNRVTHVPMCGGSIPPSCNVPLSEAQPLHAGTHMSIGDFGMNPSGPSSQALPHFEPNAPSQPHPFSTEPFDSATTWSPHISLYQPRSPSPDPSFFLSSVNVNGYVFSHNDLLANSINTFLGGHNLSTATNHRHSVSVVPVPSNYGSGFSDVIRFPDVSSPDCFGATSDVPRTHPLPGDQFFYIFLQHCVEEQSKAIRTGSSIYAAAERFIWYEGDESMMVTYYAVLREEYDRALSPAATQITATQDDLIFGYVTTNQAVDLDSLDDPLHYQCIKRSLLSKRAIQALWDLGRLPPGSHKTRSKTFVWLQRRIIYLGDSTSPGGAPVMDIQSGSNEYPLREFHQLTMLTTRNRKSYTLQMYSDVVESKLRALCIKAVQAWFIGVLTEAAKLSDKAQRFQFVERNKTYMLEAAECFIRSLSKFGTERPIHICSVDCDSNPLPSFQYILGEMRTALNELFPSQEIVDWFIMNPGEYPTEDHIRLSRHVASALFLMYYTSMLLPHDKMEFDADLQCGLAEARLKLAVSPGPTLIWNYLPVHVALEAEGKLEWALGRFAQYRRPFLYT